MAHKAMPVAFQLWRSSDFSRRHMVTFKRIKKKSINKWDSLQR